MILDEKAVGVRIVGEKKNYGRVEINYKGLWDPVCGDKWGIQDSHVVCRMRGYKAALAGINKFREGNARQVTWVSEVECRGNERIISQCYHRGWNYRHCAGLVHAGVLCYNETGTFKKPQNIDYIYYINAQMNVQLYEHLLYNINTLCNMMGYLWCDR